jgi:hypothetical protein
VRTEYIVSDKKILDVFNETFLLSELRLIANELKRQDVLKRKALQTPIALYNNNQSELNSSNVIMGSGKHIADIVRNSDNVFNINIMVNKEDDKTSMPFSRPPQRPPQRPPPPRQATATQQQATTNSHNTPYNQNIQNILNSIGNKNNEAVSLVMNNASTVGNIGTIANVGAGINAVSSGADIRNTNLISDISNIVSATSGTSGATSGTSGATSGTSGATSGTSGTTSGTESTFDQDYNEYKDNYNTGYDTGEYDDTSYDTSYDDTSYEQELPSRIYDPIDYKYHYRGEYGLPRPNVCSYGTKQIVQPIFLNSSTLFQGTDLREAAENTQVGSIMPKFEYYEYEDTV